MSRPVPAFPSLPRAPNAAVPDQMVQFDADLSRALFMYLSDMARRVNEALTVDGQSPMEGNLNLGGFALTNLGGITLPSSTVAGVPSAAPAGQLRYITNEVGGAVPAFSDGTNWRRVTDRAIIA